MHIRKNAIRFAAVFLTLIVFLFIFSIKLVLIQVFKSEHLANLADKQHNYFIELEPIRGTVYDRSLRPLAFNVSVHSLFANPRMMSEEDKTQAISVLQNILDLDVDYLKNRLSRDKFFVWIKRKLPLDMVERIKSEKVNGLSFISESKRYYPNGPLASHIIGFAGMDNQGLEGVELKYDSHLAGKPGKARILRDARQRELMIEKSFIPPQHGFHIVLTIDETIQYLAERELEKAFKKYKATSGTIIVMDVKTGEILAMANRPTYDLSDIASSEIAQRTNRAVSYIYEPGSVFKVVTASAALEENAFTEEDKIFCENGKYKIANHILHDHKPHGELTVREVFELSSNIGTAKIAQTLGAHTVYKYAERFRFGMKTNIDLYGEVAGVLKHPREWSKTTISAIPMGHEVTTTPLQLVAALAAIANDGLYMKPFVVKYIKDNSDQIIKEFQPEIVDRVISKETANRVRDILVGVVDTGTGRNAQIENMMVAGKTGTAQKVIDGQYSHSKFYATFMGFAPADNPRLAAVVVLDEPRPQYFGGTVSAPVFKTVVENSLRYLDSRDDDSGTFARSDPTLTQALLQ